MVKIKEVEERIEKRMNERTYACALLGIPVPCPTPFDQFVPENVRRSWEREWPEIGGGRRLTADHGWRC